MRQPYSVSSKNANKDLTELIMNKLPEDKLIEDLSKENDYGETLTLKRCGRII